MQSINPNPNGDAALAKTLAPSTQNLRILLISAHAQNSDQVAQWLEGAGYRLFSALDAAEALAFLRSRGPDLVILDSSFQAENLLQFCRNLRESGRENLPILLLLKGDNGSDHENTVKNLIDHEDGLVEDFLISPLNRELLLAKVANTLKLSTLRHELQISNSMLKELTLYLDNMVEAKVTELENVNRLRRFFSPQIVEAIVSEDADEVLKEHRAEITVVFLDLREFTPYAETHSPQEVMQLVRGLHQTVGPIIFRHGGTLERFTGDGLMVFLGDPKPLPDHPLQAVRMALDIQDAVNAKRDEWLTAGYNFGLGVGISTGEATMGSIGFEKRYDYAAIGTVTNLAARLCSRAQSGQILMARETYDRLNGLVQAKDCGELRLKGFLRPVSVFAVNTQPATAP